MTRWLATLVDTVALGLVAAVVAGLVAVAPARADTPVRDHAGPAMRAAGSATAQLVPRRAAIARGAVVDRRTVHDLVVPAAPLHAVHRTSVRVAPRALAPAVPPVAPTPPSARGPPSDRAVV